MGSLIISPFNKRVKRCFFRGRFSQSELGSNANLGCHSAFSISKTLAVSLILPAIQTLAVIQFLLL